jgi:S1-C subfamily serine protease
MNLPPEPDVQAPVEKAAPPRPVTWTRSFAALMFALVSFLLVFLLGALALPSVVARWRAIESKSEADALYQKRRAELRAEAEAAKEMLDHLDKRIETISLGFREVVRRVSPSVVNVASFASKRDPDNKDSQDWPDVFDPETGKPCLLSGSGSGVIIKPGWILTNHHVISSAYRVRVTFASGHAINVDNQRIKSDALTDLAAIELPPPTPGTPREDADVKIEFANSDDLERGDLVLAIGSPLGLKNTVTHGIVSAKGRLLDLYDVCEVLQTDAPMNKGNSGGPLFDHRGKLIGINFAIALDKEKQSVGIGFAIPINTARDIFQKLEQYNEVARGYLGIDSEELTRKEADGLGLAKRGSTADQLRRAWPAGESGRLAGGGHSREIQRRAAHRAARQTAPDANGHGVEGRQPGGHRYPARRATSHFDSDGG